MLRHGTAESALRAVSAELFTVQDQVATLTTQLTEARGKIPAEGSVVLPKAEADNLAKIRALGTVDEIVAGMKERGELKTQTAANALEKLAREAATALGFDPEAFADHAKTKGLHIEMRDAQVVEAGKTVTKKLPHVRPAADANAPLKVLSEYSAALPAHEQRALKPTAAAPPPTGTLHPVQSPPPPAGTTGDAVSDYLTKRNALAAARPNPLAPRQPAAAGAV